MNAEEIEIRSRRDEIVSRFSPEFRESLKRSAVAHKAVEALVRNYSPYRLIEDLIRITEDSQSALSRLLLSHPDPKFDDR